MSDLVDRYSDLCAAQRKPLAAQRWTFVGPQVMGGSALFLVNDEAHSTRSLVTYRDDRPVAIRFVGSPFSILRQQIRQMREAA